MSWIALLFLLICVGVPVLLLVAHSSFGRAYFSSTKTKLCHWPRYTQIEPYAGVHSICGKRPYMEDTYQGLARRYNGKLFGLFGVFDGHGGARASEYAMNNLHELIMGHDSLTADPAKALTDALIQLDKEWLNTANQCEFNDGSTAIVAMLAHGMVWVANVGDSRAILCKGTTAVPLSVDHKPSRPDERKRIEQLGGRIIMNGILRVQGNLALTRAIGDRKLKRYVPCRPEITVRKLDPLLDSFVVLASDGLWDVMRNRQVVEYLQRGLKKLKRKRLLPPRTPKHSLREPLNGELLRMLSEELVREAFRRGSQDNITVMVIDCAHFFVEKDAKHDDSRLAKNAHDSPFLGDTYRHPKSLQARLSEQERKRTRRGRRTQDREVRTPARLGPDQGGYPNGVSPSTFKFESPRLPTESPHIVARE